MTTEELIKDWMVKAGQHVPEDILDVDDDLVKMYDDRVDEEYRELALELLKREDYINEVKETADLIWVCNAKLWAMGLNPAVVMAKLYVNNDKKHGNSIVNEEGKTVPKDLEVKKRLKREMYESLDSYVCDLELRARSDLYNSFEGSSDKCDLELRDRK